MALPDWKYKRSHTITCETDLTDYQVMLKIYNTEGTASGNTVYLDGKCKSDFSDIRFTDDEGSEIPYWIETITEDHADIWVKVPDISESTTIWIYYGNDEVSTTSNGYDTFMVFDDFSENTIGTKWTESILYITGTSNWMSTHKIENGGYHAWQPTKADRAAGLCLTTPLVSESVNHIKMTYTGRIGRNPPFTNFIFGFYTSKLTFGYWGSINGGFNPNSPSDSIDIVWSDGSASENIQVYRNGVLIVNHSGAYAANRQPSFAVRTGGSETIDLYYKTFYSRKYSAVEPVHTTWSGEIDNNVILLRISKVELITGGQV